MERLLEGVDALLYLLDYSKLKSRWAVPAVVGPKPE